MFLTTHLLLQDQGAQQGGGYTGIIMIVAMVAIFYFFMIRPQNKKQKQIKEARSRLEKGSKVVTAGGIYGRITKVSETTFMIEVAPGVELKIEKNSVYPLVDDNSSSNKDSANSKGKDKELSKEKVKETEAEE